MFRSFAAWHDCRPEPRRQHVVAAFGVGRSSDSAARSRAPALRQPASPPTTKRTLRKRRPQAADPGPEAGPLRDPGGPTIPGLGPLPGLGQFLRPDGFDLPGGVGFIRRTPDQIGVHINTPDGPFEFTIPRRQRAAGKSRRAACAGRRPTRLLRRSSPSTARPSLGTPTAPEAGNPAGLESNEPPGRPRGSGGPRIQDQRASLSGAKLSGRVAATSIRRCSGDPGDRDLLQLRSLDELRLGRLSDRLSPTP